MPDVFVSYARSTEAEAQTIAAALKAEGYDVWRDDQIPAHKAYAEVIEDRLRTAKAVVVIWSADAAKSQWVRAEADAARELGTLVQVRIDETMPPMPFNQIQCASIAVANGRVSGPGWDKLQQSVAVLAGTERSAPAVTGLESRPKKNSICVLPFTNMSGDAEQDYFSDGISEDITTDLSKVSALEVTARNTAFTLKGTAFDVCEIATKLGVSHVLEGSVRKAGSRVRVTAQLIDGGTGNHLWAERYDRELADIFAIQDEISKAIVAALKLKLLPGERKAIEQRGTANVDAYNLYLMARKYWVSGNYGDHRREDRVVRLCRRAIEIDPEYAQAWALMALAEVSLFFSFGMVGNDGQKSAERALEIDPDIAEAYAVKARILSERGQFAEAQVQIETALRIDPESWDVNREAARLSMAKRDIAAATGFYEKAVALSETDYHSWAMVVTCYHAVGASDAAQAGARMMVSQSEKVLAEDPSNGAALGICAGGHAILGHREQAMETIERALLIDPDNLNMRYNFACVLAGYLSEFDAALDLLEPVFAAVEMSTVNTAAVDPDLDSLRGNPRFQEMLAAAQRRLGMETPPPLANLAEDAEPPRS